MVRQISSFSALDSIFDSLFNTYFYSWPKETKPPMEVFPIVDPEAADATEVKGVEIQMALAGFTEEDVELFIEDDYLRIKGDNTQKDQISSRFKCKFDHKIPYSKQLDLKNSKVSLVDGILRVEILIIEPKKTRQKLFGK